MVLKFLKKNYPFDKGYLIVPKYLMILHGYWPYQKKTVKLVIWQIINMLILIYACCGEIVYGIVNIRHLLQSLDAFCPATERFITVVKLSCFLIYRKRLKSLLEELRINIKKEMISPEKIEIAQIDSSIQNTMTFIMFAFSTLTNTSYFTRPLRTNFMEYIRNENITLELPFKIVSPDILTKEFPAYPFTYLILAWSGCVTIHGFCGVDGILLGFCMHISSLFQILQKDIQNIFLDIEKNDKMASEIDNEICYEKLKIIIERHNSIIDLANAFRTLFTPIIMCHFFLAAISICLAIIDVMMNTGYGIVMYVFYSCAVLVQLFLYCLAGTQLIDTSSEIGNVVYNLEWYKCNTKVRKMLILIIMRSQRTSSIAVPFFSPSFEAFGTVLSTTLSYVALVKTFL